MSYIPATPTNMEKYPGLAAMDPETGDVFSATAGDYFWQPPNEPLRNESGKALILAVTISEHHEPFKP